MALSIFSVHILDEDDHVDVIMMFDYNPMVLQMPQVLETKYKTLIKWGEKIPDSIDEDIQVMILCVLTVLNKIIYKSNQFTCEIRQCPSGVSL